MTGHFTSYKHPTNHELATLINADVDVRLVQEFIGHKTPAMTMHYMPVSPKRLQALRVTLKGPSASGAGKGVCSPSLAAPEGT